MWYYILAGLVYRHVRFIIYPIALPSLSISERAGARIFGPASATVASPRSYLLDDGSSRAARTSSTVCGSLPFNLSIFTVCFIGVSYRDSFSKDKAVHRMESERPDEVREEGTTCRIAHDQFQRTRPTLVVAVYERFPFNLSSRFKIGCAARLFGSISAGTKYKPQTSIPGKKGDQLWTNSIKSCV